jgi:glycerol-3-phosphate acyltransferase PlsY
MEYLFILIGYLSGSVPYGLIFSRIFGKLDIRKIGSGNIGTTNVLRSGHKGIAAATLICDLIKGFLPVYVASYFGIHEYFIYLTAFAAIIGHIFPIWLKYRGGKGVATALGVFWAISLPLGIFVTFIWIVTTRFARISSLSSLCMFTLSPIFALLVLSNSTAIFCLIVTLLIYWTHRTNISRLISGQEGEISGLSD